MNNDDIENMRPNFRVISEDLRDKLLSQATDANRQDNVKHQLWLKEMKTQQNMREFHDKIGPRYAGCSLENFVIQNDDGSIDEKKLKVIDNLNRFAADIQSNVRDRGVNLMFCGPVGSGKDHLMAAMMTEAAKAGESVEWINGVELFGQTRDLIDIKGEQGRESKLVDKYSRPQLLGISDPNPPSASNSGWANEWLFRIIDARYRFHRPTYMTINAETRREMDAIISLPTCDRLMDNSILVMCYWNSYRKRLGEFP